MYKTKWLKILFLVFIWWKTVWKTSTFNIPGHTGPCTFCNFFFFLILCCKHRILVNKLGTPAVPLTLKMNCELACTVLQYRSRGGLTNHTKGAFQGSPQMHTQCIFLVFPFLKWNEKNKKKRFSFLFNSFSVENKMTRRYTDPQT